MCNLSEAIAEEYLEKGIEKGMEQGIETIIANFLRKDNHISHAVLMPDVSAEQVRLAAKKHGITVEE